MRVGERPKDVDGVIADGEQGDAVRLESRPHRLQLDQLRPAERSPVRAAVEDDERLAASACRVQINRGTVLVGQADVGKPFPLGRPDLREVSRR